EFTEYFIVTYTFREFLGGCSRIGRVTLGVEVLGYGLGLLGAETKCTVGLRLQCTKVEWNRGLPDGLLYPHTFYRCIGAPALFKDLFDGFLLEYPAPAAFRNQVRLKEGLYNPVGDGFKLPYLLFPFNEYCKGRCLHPPCRELYESIGGLLN